MKKPLGRGRGQYGSYNNISQLKISAKLAPIMFHAFLQQIGSIHSGESSSQILPNVLRVWLLFQRGEELMRRLIVSLQSEEANAKIGTCANEVWIIVYKREWVYVLCGGFTTYHPQSHLHIHTARKKQIIEKIGFFSLSEKSMYTQKHAHAQEDHIVHEYIAHAHTHIPNAFR